MLMRLLHLLPPETAHTLTLKVLQYDLGPALNDSSDLSVSLFGKRIRNPIGLSAGADKRAQALAGWSKMGFGLVEAGSVTLHPRSGNPEPRMWRMPGHSVINWLGMPGQGLEPFVKNLAAFAHHPARRQLCVGASIASPNGVLDEFKILAAGVAPYVDYITLNASCPNVTQQDHAAEDTAAQHIAAAKEGAGKVPVLIKLGPTREPAALERMVHAALKAGVDGFVATNTVPFANRAILNQMSLKWPKHQEKEVGAFSGPPLLEISTWMVSQIRTLIPQDMPLIGVGGIHSGADAQRMLKAGANAFQIYTGLIYHGPKLLQDIAQRLNTDYLKH